MRETLTFLAAGVLLLLALAFAIPPFIDWTSYGAALGARFGQALGADVQLGGSVSIRLLPSPHLQTGAVRVTRPGLDIAADGASLELALAPLLRGALTITSAQLDRPQITINTSAPAPAWNVGDLGIDRLALRDATVVLKTPAGTRRLDHLDVIASAESASGPFKAQGFVRADNRLLPFRVATGSIKDAGLAVKLDIDPLAGLPKGEASGSLKFGEQPRFEGIMTLSGEIEGGARDGGALPWRVRLDGTASPQEIRADKVDVRAGDDRASFAATGTARIAESGLTIKLASERPDLDRLRAAYSLQRIANVVSANASSSTFAIDWRTDASVLGGEVVNDARVTMSRAEGDPFGRTKLGLSFAVTRGGTFSFTGHAQGVAHAAGDVAFRTDDAPALTRWLTALSPDLSVSDVPVRRVDIAGHVEIGGSGIVVSNLRASLDRSLFAGRLALMAPKESNPKLTADLKAGALDLDALPNLSEIFRQSSGIDLAIDLDAQAIRVARVGRASVETGHISLTASRIGNVLSLNRLALDNVGGATLHASGEASAKEARLKATLNATQLGDVTALMRRIAPGATTDALAARAALLAPATLDISLQAKSAQSGAFLPVQVTATGKFADTNLRASITPRSDNDAALDGTLSLDAPEAAPLLRQMGVPVIPLRGQGGAKIEAMFGGKSDGPVALRASAMLAGTDVRFEGTTRLASEPAAAGSLKVSSRDLGPLLRIVAAPVNTFSGLPADAVAQIEFGDRRYSANNIAGHVGNTTVAGSLARNGSGPVTGALHLDQLNVASVAAILLGPPQRGTSDRAWSALAFSQQPNDPPDAAIDLSVNRMMLSDSVEAANATMKFSMHAGAIEANKAHMDLSGGTVHGSVALRRQDRTASFDTSLQADNIKLNLPWLTARVSGHVDLSGAGTSPATLVSSLGGKGSLRVKGLEIARVDPDAPSRVAKAVDAEEIGLDIRTINQALARAFDTGPQRSPTFEQPVVIAGGQSVTAPVDLTIGTARVTLDSRYDLARDRVELHEAVRSAPPDAWIGAPPTVAITFAGLSSSPVRTIEATDLIATLAAHGIAREQARIAAQEVDQRERTFFNRRLKFDRALEAHRRAEEARVEAARLEAARQEALRREAARQEALRQEALRQERERREAQRARELEGPAGTAPLDVRPPAAARSGNAPNIIAPDPGTAGRY